MTVKLDHKTTAALKMIAAEQHAQTGRNTALNEVVWGLIEKCAPETAAKVNALTNQGSVGKS